MKTENVKVTVFEYHYGTFTASCELIQNKFFDAKTRKDVILQIIAELQKMGLSGNLKITDKYVAEKVNQQESAYRAYQARGGKLPLDMYLNN